MKYLLSLVVFLVSQQGFTQNYEKYNIENIPSDLRDNANLVIRDYDLIFEILPNSHLIESTHKVITILNKSADEESALLVFYDKFRTVKKFSAVILDKNGSIVKKLKKTDIVDFSIAQNSVDDSRLKAADMSYYEYPYSIVFDYAVDYDGLFYYPNYIPQYRGRISIERSKFVINFPHAFKPRYKELNINVDNETATSYEWRIDNLPAFKDVPFSPDITEFVPIVLTAPDQFDLAGNEGNMSTWWGFAEWYRKLNKGRDLLCEAEIKKVKELTKGLNSKEDIIKRVYEYMQTNSRYVSVQLGIGGYQTMPASEVAENGWGDCKALSNYMKALLNSVNIKAYPALVYAGSGAPNIIADFPSNQFNHVILCVPLGIDTVWLECTSRDMPFNYLGAFTGDRNVLFINEKESGGEIIRTPRYEAEQNYIYRKAAVVVDKNGDGNAIVKTNYGGLSFDKLLHLLDEPELELEKHWYKNNKSAGLKIEKISFDYNKIDGPEAEQYLELSLHKYAKQSGPDYLFYPNLLNRESIYPKKDLGRIRAIEIPSEFIEIDSIEFNLPEGYYLEHLPENININTKFGSYSAHFEANQTGFLYVRRLKRLKGSYQSDSYDELYDLLKKITQLDRNKVVITGST